MWVLKQFWARTFLTILTSQQTPAFKVGVKVPQFSFMQLEGADPLLGVEMQSTGEVACFGENFFDAFCKALGASGYKIPMEGNVLISVGGTELKAQNAERRQKIIRNEIPNFRN